MVTLAVMDLQYSRLSVARDLGRRFAESAPLGLTIPRLDDLTDAALTDRIDEIVDAAGAHHWEAPSARVSVGFLALGLFAAGVAAGSPWGGSEFILMLAAVCVALSVVFGATALTVHHARPVAVRRALMRAARDQACRTYRVRQFAALGGRALR